MEVWEIEMHEGLLRNHEGHEEKQPFLPAFGKNTESCIQFGSMCSYLNICKGVSDPSRLEEPPEGFVIDRWSPFDELKLAEIGLQPEKEDSAKPNP